MKAVFAVGLPLILLGCASVPVVPARQPKLAADGWQQITGPAYVSGFKVDAALGCDKSKCGGFGFVAVGSSHMAPSDAEFVDMKAKVAHLRAGDTLPETAPRWMGDSRKAYILTKLAVVTTGKIAIEVIGEFDRRPQPGRAIAQAEITKGGVQVLLAGGETTERARTMVDMARYLEVPR